MSSMVLELSTHLLRRSVAALLVLALAGASGALPSRTAREHRCLCSLRAGGGHHQCSCPICRLAALRRTAADASAPAGHRAAAMAALQEESAKEEHAGPCLSSGCDGPSGRPGTNTPLDPFVLPAEFAPRFNPHATPGIGPPGVPSTRARIPEVPPPRAVPT